MPAKELNREWSIVVGEVQGFLYPDNLRAESVCPTWLIAHALRMRTDAEIEAALIHLDAAGAVRFKTGGAQVGLTEFGATLARRPYFLAS